MNNCEEKVYKHTMFGYVGDIKIGETALYEGKIVTVGPYFPSIKKYAIKFSNGRVQGVEESKLEPYQERIDVNARVKEINSNITGTVIYIDTVPKDSVYIIRTDEGSYLNLKQKSLQLIENG